MPRPDKYQRAYDAVMPRLAAAYESGKLVPFIGAGMSIPACTDWNNFVYRLEKRAEPTKRARSQRRAPPPADIIRRANRAVRLLKSQNRDTFIAAVRHALATEGAGEANSIPAQTRALARLWWPLVLTTNYDNCYVAAFRGRFNVRRFNVLGRSPGDCQRVLHALNEPASSILWALQGFLDGPHRVRDFVAPPRLADQLVVGHDEYRRVTYRDMHFRRAFAEVFRSRSLLFLGSGIRENYLQELFGEVLEMYGPSSRPHYAIMPEGEADAEFLLARFQIVVIPYPKGKHAVVAEQLNTLADGIERSSRRSTSWGWGRPLGSGARKWDSVPELEVARSQLPTSIARKECLIISAGGTVGGFFYSSSIRELLRRLGIREHLSPTRRLGRYVGWYPRRHVFAVRARSDDDERGLEHIYRAALEVLTYAAKRYQVAHMQLLAAGGSDDAREVDAAWRLRTFPERYSFVQIVRAYAEWRRRHPRAQFRLVLHVIAAPVHMEIASGRLQVLELLTCSDVRFWAEVHTADEEVERRLFQVAPTIEFDAIRRAMNLPKQGWTVEVSPAPNLLDLEEGVRDLAQLLRVSLQELGVVPGSLLLFRRRFERSMVSK
ncbi:MAG: SIR2 family NAD-dependent protein deacylase [Planctomycetota bacterium]